VEVKIMSKVNVRYIVSDVDAAIPFYTDMLGFKLEMHPAPGFASLSRGNLQLLLNRPGGGGAGQAMPGGQHSCSRWLEPNPDRSRESGSICPET
jgi:catechol 2,3-dioxygenase-like lactoylglutathione lyase family enzyme